MNPVKSQALLHDAVDAPHLRHPCLAPTFFGQDALDFFAEWMQQGWICSDMVQRMGERLIAELDIDGR